jgi:hypothetical protein
MPPSARKREKKISKVLVKEATSPEITDEEDNTQRRVLSFVWELSLLRHFKCDLDREYDKELKVQSKRQRAKVVRSRTELTTTPSPGNIPYWAISSSYN